MRQIISLITLALVALSCFTYTNAATASQSYKVVRILISKTTSMESGLFGQPITSFYTNVGVGTPSKPFRLSIDIDEQETWLPHYNKLGLIYRRLNYRNGYSKKDSQSSVKEDREFSFVYKGCELTGKPYEDLYEFYNVSESWNQMLFRHRFLAISSAGNDKLSDLGVDGVLSFSPRAISDSGSSSTLVNLFQAKLIDDLRLSLWLNSSTGTDQGGEMTLGGVNPTRYSGNIHYHILAPVHDRWEIYLQNAMLGGQVVSCHQSNCTAVLSTGTNDFYGPEEDVRKIMSLLGVSKPSQSDKDGRCDGDICEIDCLRVVESPYLTFNIGGLPYVVPPSSYIKKKVDGVIFKSSTCFVSIFPNKSRDNQWILGTNFLSNFYTVLDFNRRQVGFAARHN